MRSTVVGRVDVPSLQTVGSGRFPTDDVTFIQLIPISGGRVLAYDGSSGRIREIDPGRGQLLSATDLPGHQLPVNPPSPGARGHTITLSADEQTLYAVVPDGGIIGLDVPRGQVFRRLTPDKHYLAIALSSDGTMLYTVSSAVRTWYWTQRPELSCFGATGRDSAISCRSTWVSNRQAAAIAPNLSQRARG